MTFQAAETYNNEVMAPIDGTVIPLKSVHDEVFSSEAMGKGIAIVPTNGNLKAPVTGTISAVYPTGHAIGLISDQGAEILLHIGIDTVKLNGQYFETLVKKEQHVTVGEEIVSFDLEKIKAAGYDPTVMLVVTNSKDYEVNSTTETAATNNWLLKLKQK